MTDFAPRLDTVPAQAELGKYIEIDAKWQYGVSGKERFLVYHPKTRKPFDVSQDVGFTDGGVDFNTLTLTSIDSLPQCCKLQTP